jgi:N-carbamoylputrescine amidase
MTKKRPVKLGLIQMSCVKETAENVRKATELVRQAAAAGAQIVILPELFTTLYFCQEENHDYFELAESVPGPTTDAMAKLAGELGVVIIASLFERRAPGLYHNTTAVLDADGTYMGKYRKMHIPDDPLFYEKFYFTPGDLGFKVFDTKFGKIGTLICWDQWYPEGARIAALRGAELLVYPTAIGWHPSEKAEHGEGQYVSWETIQRSHGIANGCFVASINRVGKEVIVGDGLEFWGQSFVSDPSGMTLVKGTVADEQVLVTEVDFGKVDVRRVHWPFLRDRRIDAYGDIMARYLDGDR